MNTRTHIIIQARMGATRLPGKILLPFAGGKTFLEWIVERMKQSQRAEEVIVATTDSPKDDQTAALCEANGYRFFRGSEDDVLARYLGAAREAGSEIIVRATSDNPLTDVSELDRAVDILAAEGLDYVSTHPAGLPVGTGVEVFTMASFEKVALEAKDEYEHEHVTPYYYRHKDLFSQREIAPQSLHGFAPSARLTLDTPEDLTFLRALAESIGLNNPATQPTTNEILDYLEAHPELVSINQAVVQKTFPKA